MSTEQQTDGQEDPVVHNTNQLIKLCNVLMDQYAVEHLLLPTNVSRIKLSQFLHWFKPLAENGEPDVIQNFVDKAGVSSEYWLHLAALSSCLEGIEQLQRIWPQIALGRRLPPQHKLDSMHTITLLRWADGRAAPLSCFSPSILANIEGNFQDSDVSTLMAHNGGQMQQMLLDNSLDVLHDHRSQPATTDDFELVMGLLLLITSGSGVIFKDVPPALPNTVMLKLEDGLRIPANRQEGCKSVLRILQAMFSPPLPAYVQQKIAQLQERNKRKPEANGETKPAPTLGGWDS